MPNSTLENYLEEQHSTQDDYYDREVGVYHASSSAHCIRRMYLDFVKGKKPGSDAYPHFELGNKLETVYERALEAEYGWRHVKNSIPVRHELGKFVIVGETDPVVLGHNGEIEKLYEVKTTSGLSYVKDEPKIEHVYQVHAYMKALGLDECTIVYLQKTDLETAEHVVEFDPEIWNEIVTKFSIVHQALDAGEMPPPQPEEDHDYFCPYDDEDVCCKNTG